MRAPLRGARSDRARACTSHGARRASDSARAQVAVEPSDGCSPNLYQVRVRDKVALLHRGGCGFGEKCQAAQKLGAPDCKDTGDVGAPKSSQLLRPPELLCPTAMTRRLTRLTRRRAEVTLQHLPTSNVIPSTAECANGIHNYVTIQNVTSTQTKHTWIMCRSHTR